MTIKGILFAAMAFVASAAWAQTPKAHFGATPPLRVSGKEIVDPNGKAVTLHGVMDTPNCYFNGGRWGWRSYDDPSAIAPCREYFTKVFDAITDTRQGTFCNLFRLHLDPAWIRDNGFTRSGFTEVNDGDKTAKDPHGNKVGDEANVCHFSMALLKQRMADLYVPIMRDALAHGLYVIVRPPGVFPHNVVVGDYYNDYLMEVWDIVSKDDFIRAHSGQVSLELGNEPVSMTGGTLVDYFQPIVNRIRANGFDGILWLPGTGWQMHYEDYYNSANNTLRVSDAKNNLGFAVHCYPGWYSTSHATFLSQVSVINAAPIVVTEVDWSPESQNAAPKTNEWGAEVPGNFGTWGTGSTWYNDMKNSDGSYKYELALPNSTQNDWGIWFKTLVDQHPNISFTLQGTTTYVDMDRYLRDGTVQPAFLDAMRSEGYPDAYQACSGSCFDWYRAWACGDRLPEYKTEGAMEYDDTDGRYYFKDVDNASLLLTDLVGISVDEIAELTIACGSENSTGYRLDFKLKDANGEYVQTADSENWIIGNEGNGTRSAAPIGTKTYDIPSLFAEYIKDYPGCTFDVVRIHTAAEKASDTDYYITFKGVSMVQGHVSAVQSGVALSSLPFCRWNVDGYVEKTYDSGFARLNEETDGELVGVGLLGWVLYNEYMDLTGYQRLEIDCTGTGRVRALFNREPHPENKGSYTEVIQDIADGKVVLGLTRVQDAKGRIHLNSIKANAGRVKVTAMRLYDGTVRDGEAATDVTTLKFQKMTTSGEFESYFDNSYYANGEVDVGSVVAGPNNNGNVYYTEYLDLTGYTRLEIEGTGGQLRCMVNRKQDPNNIGGEGLAITSVDISFADGKAVLDLTQFGEYVHLNSIKTGWGSSANITAIKAYKPVVGGSEEVATDLATLHFVKFNDDPSVVRGTLANNVVLNQPVGSGGAVAGTTSVRYDEYIDLSAFDRMEIDYESAGQSRLRVLMNRASAPGNTGALVEVSYPMPSAMSGTAVLDLTQYEYAHLNAIKVEGADITVKSIRLYKDDVVYCDYALYGVGCNDESADGVLSKRDVTSIDATGVAGSFAHAFMSANPNCLFIQSEEQGTRGLLAGTQNLVTKGDGDSYSAAAIVLSDGYDFHSPVGVAISAGAASYSRELTSQWATGVLPFSFTVDNSVAEVYVLESVAGNKMAFTPVAEGATVEANTGFVYRKRGKGTAQFVNSADGIAKSDDQYVLQPSGLDDWYLCYSLTEDLIEDVAAHPLFSNYAVYAISSDTFVHATKTLKVKPFRAFFLCKPKSAGAAVPRFVIEATEDNVSTSIADIAKPTPQAVEVYDAAGRRIATPRRGVNIVRMSDGTVRKEMR